MAGLTIKISADTQGAVTQFKELAGSSDTLAAAIEKANAKFASANIQKFTDSQKLAQAALTATRGETGAVEASIGAYQRKIESLIKQGLSPESEQVQTLIAEMETLTARKDALASATEAEAQREAELAAKFEAAAQAAEREAETVARSLDAKSGLEKENIRLAAEQDRVRESIKKLIASGMDPESEEVKTLEGEYKNLTREIETNNKARAMQENAAKGAATALGAIAAATAAVIGYSVTQAAKVEDMTAAYTTLLGSQEKAAALVKRINTEAATTPFEIDSISGSMNKLLPLFKGNSDAAVKAFRMIGDTAGGNAQKLETLTDAYTKVQMKGKTSMEELNRISNAGVPIFDVLSKKLGVTTEKLFEMSSAGEITAADLTGAFQQMTSEGGIFFNGMENSSDTFNMRLLGIKENVNILAGEIGAKLLPELKETAGAVAEFSEWVGEGDNLERLLEGVGYALAGVTGGLAAFLAVSKGAAVINTLSAALKGLTAAMKANPIGAVAVAVTAVAVPAFIALVKYLDESANKVRTLNNELAKEKDIHSEAVTALEGLGDAKTIDADTTDKLIRLYPELTGKIEAYKTSVDDAKRVVEELNKQKSKDTIDGMVAAYKKETEALEKRNKEIEATKYVAENSMGVQKEAAQRTLATQEAALAEMKKHAEQSKAAIVSAYRGIGEEVVLINFGEFITKPLKALPKEGVKTGKETGGNIADGIEKTLSEKLKGIKLTPEQNFSENEAAFASYLNSIAGMEKLSGEERVAAIEAQEQRIRKSLKLTEDEKRALSDASADLQKQALDKEAKEAAAAREAEKALRQKEFEDMVSERDQLIDLYTRRHEAEKAVGEQSYEQRLEDLALYHMLETAALEEQIAAIREMTDIDNEWKVAEEERINLEMLESDKRYASAKIEIEKEAATAERALFQQRLGAAGNLAGSMSQLIKATGKENAAAAQAAKVVDMAQAAINTAMAISNALADPVPRPIAIANAVAMGIAGLAQEIAIARTPIPSAETGGRFVVPETASGVDGGLLRVNHGEVADITPRGGVSESESGGRTMIYLDGEVFVDFVNKKLRSGDIYEISPAWNMAVA